MHDWNLEATDGVWLLTMDDGENRIGAAALESWVDVLNRVEAESQPRPLVVTGTGKFWSTGLDLEEFEEYSEAERTEFMTHFDEVLGRILTAPFVTVAALNGHTIAGGALMALSHDYRIMREDQGYFSLPSVDIGIPFTPGMSALISAKMPQPGANDLVVSSRQISSAEAKELGVVTSVEGEASVVPIALRLASSLKGKHPATLRTVKQRLYRGAASLLLPSP
jgi:enoyl-CoA hydratase/carnithine racemase